MVYYRLTTSLTTQTVTCDYNLAAEEMDFYSSNFPLKLLMQNVPCGFAFVFQPLIVFIAACSIFIENCTEGGIE